MAFLDIGSLEEVNKTVLQTDMSTFLDCSIIFGLLSGCI